MSPPPTENETVAFDWNLAGTATHSTDYTTSTSTAGTATFTSTNHIKTIIVTINADDLKESSETIKLTLTNLNLTHTKPITIDTSTATMQIAELRPT